MGIIKIKNFTEINDIFKKSKTDAMVLVVSDNFNDYYAVLLSMYTPEFNSSVRKSICTHSIKLIDADTTDGYSLLFRGVSISFEEYDMHFKMIPRLYHGRIRCENIYIPYDITTVDTLLKGFNDVGIFKDINNIKVFNCEYSAILAEYSYKIKEENHRHICAYDKIRSDIKRRYNQKLRYKSKKDIDKNEIVDDNKIEEISIFDILNYIENIFKSNTIDDIDERMIKKFYELVKGKTYTEIYKKYYLTPAYITKLNREIFAKRGMPLGTRVYKNK